MNKGCITPWSPLGARGKAKENLDRSLGRDCWTWQLNQEDAVDHSKYMKLITDI